MHIVKYGIPSPLVSWKCSDDYSAFAYLSKYSYPTLLNAKLAKPSNEIKGNYIINGSDRNGASNYGVGYIRSLLDGTKIRLRYSLYVFIISLALVFVINTVTFNNINYSFNFLHILFGAAFYCIFFGSLIATIIYYVKVKTLTNQLKSNNLIEA